MRILGIVGIVAFVGFFIMRYEIFVEIMNNPGDFIDGFVNNPIEFTFLMILWLFGWTMYGA